MSDLTTRPPRDDEDPQARPTGLDRRDFLKISSTAAAAAAAATVAAAGLASDRRQPAPLKAPGRPPGADKDLKGGWFVV
ncbi:MAG: twin-arginine translocation signal domain-containing protein [Acidobacteriota bacterium]